MQSRQGYAFQSLRGVQNFINAHADKLGTIPGSGARRKLDALVAQLNEHLTTQSASDLRSQGATQSLYALRRALLDEHMRPIARIAAAELDSEPGLDAFRMPRGTPTAAVLHATAMGMAEAAEPHASIFIDAGLPTDFLARLRAAADAMLGSLGSRRQQQGSRCGATTGLKETIRSARKIVDVLDAFVSVALKDDAALLANWKSVKRPPAKPGKAAGTVVASVVASAQPQVQDPAPVYSLPSREGLFARFLTVGAINWGVGRQRAGREPVGVRVRPEVDRGLEEVGRVEAVCGARVPQDETLEAAHMK